MDDDLGDLFGPRPGPNILPKKARRQQPPRVLDWQLMQNAARASGAVTSQSTPPANTARVLAFPFARRHALINRLARQMLARSPELAERHLVAELRRHQDTLGRRQLSDDVICAQLQALEGAVRRQLGQLAESQPEGNWPPGGGAGGRRGARA
jgi:hypothetical protein